MMAAREICDCLLSDPCQCEVRGCCMLMVAENDRPLSGSHILSVRWGDLRIRYIATTSHTSIDSIFVFRNPISSTNAFRGMSYRLDFVYGK